MKKIFFIALILSQLHGDPYIDQNTFNLANVINNTVNSILGKVSSLQGNQTNTVISSADEIINEINSCCEQLSSQIDTIEGGNIDSCCDALSNQIASCCEQISSQIDIIEGGNIDSCCDAISNQIDSCCEQISSQIDSSLLCAPIPITSATTINASGTYCLANDITGTITIAASSVILDMNGHTITTTSGNGINISGFKVEVFDGRLVGSGGGVNGILLTNAIGFRLRNLTIFNFSNDGIALTVSSSNGIIEDCDITSCLVAGIEYFECNNIITRNVTVTGAFITSLDGFRFSPNNDIRNLTLDTCVARTCQNGFIKRSVVPDIYNLTLRNCQASGNTTNGFDFQSTESFLFENCMASDNTMHGFDIGGGSDTLGTIKGCVAILNGDTGFNATAVGLKNVVFISNQALSNTVAGFNISDDAAAYNNYAALNGTNYMGVSPTLTSVSVTTDTGWWTNVDHS